MEYKYAVDLMDLLCDKRQEKTVMANPKFTINKLDAIGDAIKQYLTLPFSTKAIPGHVFEQCVAIGKGGRVLETQDYADVISEYDGWQAKSIKMNSIVTWKRYRHDIKAPTDIIGKGIINSCNESAIKSLNKYNLKRIGYIQCIVYDTKIEIFERELINRKNMLIFNNDQFEWRWGDSALEGINRETGDIWWRWYGKGDNQLTFLGEQYWRPEKGSGDLITIKDINKIPSLSISDIQNLQNALSGNFIEHS